MAEQQKEDLTLSEILRPASDPLTPRVVPADAFEPPAEILVDDRILQAVQQEDTEEVVLHAVLWGLAEEQSSLKTLRETKNKEGKDTSHISLKRGTLLKYMSETLIQKRALLGASDEIDLRGPKFREIFKMFLQVISETFDEVKIPPEYKEMFFSALSHNLDGWEERAEKIARSIEPRRQGT